MTLKELRAHTVKELTQLARKHGLTGISSLNKEQLVRKLATAIRRTKRASARKRASASPGRARKTSSAKKRSASASQKGKSKVGTATSRRSSSRSSRRNGTPDRSSPAVARRIKQFHLECRQQRELTTVSGNGRPDQVMLSVLDSYWLRVQWSVTSEKVRRAQAALAQEWLSSVPVLRLLEIGDRSTTNTTETVLRDIRVHGGVNCWFIDVDNPPRTFSVDLGYLAPSGKFFVLARSNMATTPARRSRPSTDSAWEYQMGGRRMDPAQATRPVSEAIGEFVPVRKGSLPPGETGFPFELDAELVVHGWTVPGAQVTLQGENIPLRPDGSFTVRFAMPNARQVIPAVATSPDGARQQTIVLAVERNTKVLEPLVRESHS